ncbi:MAG: redoxin domain-containing protein [Rhodospirillales bacterium]|nr:redoxin domain-containing protein [Rhodospirillales bacterium]
MNGKPAGMEYNNQRFKVHHYNFDLFVGPAAGEQLKDFPLTDLETGTQVKLSDFHGKWVVLETASSTCSMYTKNIGEMEAMAAEFPDVEFVVVYVREAHPGERLHQHRNMDEKIKAAKLLKPRYGEYRRVLVDSHGGDFHRAYGSMPNVLYIIRPDGTVHFRCNWAAPQLVREALNDRENLHTLENADMLALRASRKKYNMIRTMWTGGFIALFDFFRGLPHVVAKHKLVDDYYNKHGRFKNQPDAQPGE